VVILGLIFVVIGRYFPSLAFLEKGDAIAALVVAVIVIFVSGELGMRSIHGLLDAAPKNGEYEKIITETKKMEGVKDVHAVRVRSAGAGWFVDMHIVMDGHLTLEHSHTVTEKIEEKVRSILPNSDVTVHVEPS
jgi:cation diffusion facilitator family transporter